MPKIPVMLTQFYILEWEHDDNERCQVCNKTTPVEDDRPILRIMSGTKKQWKQEDHDITTLYAHVDCLRKSIDRAVAEDEQSAQDDEDECAQAFGDVEASRLDAEAHNN